MQQIHETRFITSIRKTEKKDHDIDVIIVCDLLEFKLGQYKTRSLIEIGGRTLLDHQIIAIKKALPQSNIIVVSTNHTQEVISRKYKDCRIVENCLFENTNEVESVRLGINNRLNNNVIIINGNIFFDYRFVKGVDLSNSFILYDTSEKISKKDVGLILFQNHATGFHYHSKNKWCEITFLTNRELELVSSLCNIENNRRKLFFEILDEALIKIEKIRAYEIQCKTLKKIKTYKDIYNIKTKL